jgi:hypothetical protein
MPATTSGRGRFRKLRRAMGTTRCFDRDRHRARRTLLCLLYRLPEFVDCADEQKNRTCHNEEIDRDCDEVAIIPSYRPGFGCVSGGIERSRAVFGRSQDDELVEKSSPPVRRLTGGMTMSLTSELMIEPNAAPIITPTARSIALPLTANSLNSFQISFT